MKELRSRKYPNREPQYLSDDEYEKLKELGLSAKFSVKEVTPIRAIIPKILADKQPEITKSQQKKHETRGTKNTK